MHCENVRAVRLVSAPSNTSSRRHVGCVIGGMNLGLPRDARPFAHRSRSSFARGALLVIGLALAACAERTSGDDDDDDGAALTEASPGTDGKFRVLTDERGNPADLS